MKNKRLIQYLLYTLFLYNAYIYLNLAWEQFKWGVNVPVIPYTLYFNVAMIVCGGIIIGIMLLKMGGNFNRIFGFLSIAANVILSPIFILSAIN